MTDYSLGPLEQKIMECIWVHKEKSVHEVHSCLSKKCEIAYTTVMTIMTRLVVKKLLKRKKIGKAFIYTAKISKAETAKNVVGNIFSSLVNQYGQEAITAFSDEIEKTSVNKL